MDSEENANDLAFLCVESNSNETFSLLGGILEMENFVRVRFLNNNFYVGRVVHIVKNEKLEISFYRYNKRMNAFSKPLVPDETVVLLSHLCIVLQTTVSVVKTKQLARFVKFPEVRYLVEN